MSDVYTVPTPADDTITLSSVSGTTYGGPYTINTSNGTGIVNPWATNATLKSPRIQLNGPDADIEVNGESLMATLSIIKERLNYLQVNPELEAEWSELKQLGDQYRKLEQHIRDKQATWDKLKAVPPPDID
jgi:hypothetical protein